MVGDDIHVALPEESITRTGSTSNGLLQYSENMVHIVFSTICALVRSVPVHSMKTSLVLREICMHSKACCKALDTLG